MTGHIFDPEKAELLESKSRYRLISREELLGHVDHGDTVVDVGSGTGFFTDDIAEEAEKVYAVDSQEAMHDYYREKGVPENVELISSSASEIELSDADLIFSIFSFHELDVDEAVESFRETLRENGKVVVYDWSSRGSGEEGPPISERFDAEVCAEKMSGKFKVIEKMERGETFRVVALKN